MRTETVTLPTFLASALINGDTSGLDERDEKWVDAAHKLAEGGHYVDVADDAHFAYRNDLPGFNLGAEVATYTILYHDSVDGLGEASSSMTYGTLPRRDLFDAHFAAELGGADYPFEMKGSDSETMARVGLDAYASDGQLVSADELYEILRALTAAWQDGDDGAGDLASGFLTTLNFEWI